MTTPFPIPRWSRPFSRRCLPLLCLAWLVSDAVGRQLSFVHGVSWTGHQAKQQVTGRFSEHESSAANTPADNVAKMARSLTGRMNRAETAMGLINVLDQAVDGPVFNFFHASAAYHKMATLNRKNDLRPIHWNGPVIARLHARVQGLAQKGELNAQASANVLWTIAKLSARFSSPRELVTALVKSLPYKTKDMTTQALSNCLWASAQLKGAAPDVLEAVPLLASHILDKANAMTPQELSNCLWASAQLKKVASGVLQVVRALSARVPDSAGNMDPQALSNCLWAALQLKADAPAVATVPAMSVEVRSKIKAMKPQEVANSVEALVLLLGSAPEVARLVANDAEEEILRIAAARLNTVLPSIQGKDLCFAVTVTTWACAKARVYHREFLASVANRLGSGNEVSSLRRFNLCALAWSYEVLDAQDDFTDFRELLMSEIARQGYSQADVESCRLGRFQWNRAKPF